MPPFSFDGGNRQVEPVDFQQMPFIGIFAYPACHGLDIRIL
jgi:hypothetical protein